MPRQPLDYQRGDLPDTASAVRRFRWIVLSIVFFLNLVLLMLSLNDVFPRGRPGVHNLLAILIAVLFSPILNGLSLAFALGIGFRMRSMYHNRLRDFAVVAICAPIVGALVNLIVALVIVPWHSPKY